jgi:cytochrome b6-f complex iron-sulfur subunit
LGVAIAIIVIVIVAGASIVLFASRARSSTGALSRETRKRDQSSDASEDAPALSTSTELEATGRERADETRESLGGGVLTRRRAGQVVEYEPVDEEELGVTRRQFLNRGLLTAVGFSIAGFAPAMLAFLWPFGSTGFGGKFPVGTVPDIISYIQTNRKPFYQPQARTYLVQYPASALPNAKKVYKPAIYSGMEKGLVALYQRCVHLGCRVPFCDSSQWFECPCHGSKYNRVGEKRGGPAPRGLDRFVLEVSGGNIVVDTGNLVLGPPIGTNTINQSPEGPLCV